MRNLHNFHTYLVFSFLISACFMTDGSKIILLSEETFTFYRNQTIVSHSDVFELGIFTPNSSSPDVDRWYLGIWFKKISIRTYVWVANRANPLSSPIGTIRVWKSKLILSDQSNTQVWSTPITKESERSPIVAELLDDGNFVLRNSNNSDRGGFLWQSFDFPTNTLLPGMKLGWELRTGRNSLLRSWNDLTDPSIGDHSYGIEAVRGIRVFPTLFLWSGRYKVNRISPWNGVFSLGVPRNQPLTYLTFTLTANKEEESFSFQTSNNKYTSILKVTHVGSLQQLMWNETSSEWDLLWRAPTDNCDLYRYCGPYSYCDMSVCKCMREFEPKNPQAWALKNREDGCVRTTALSCSEDKFFRLTDIRLPDTTKALLDWEVGFNEYCERRCARDCNCTAFTTVKQSGRSGCVIWTGELLDVRKYVADGQDVYVKYHEKKQPKAKLIIGLSVALGFIIILSAIVFCYRRRNKKRARAALEFATLIGRFSEENIMENLELPLMSFKTISLATDNFNDLNKLGRGGFGIVYKGRLLDGDQEIAVKRLSKISGQGIDEFKNELMLITKVQHINLVRLLGYSVNGDEKLLIYEYLENRSLDLYLFDQTRSSKLNWPMRFEIAKGIARGLLYLHQDSAVLIIHRDLKPSNVLLDKDMTPKISDFGMARIFERGENEVDTTKVVGTRGYMSPEYSQDGTYSVKSDVFSFGVIILEIISGKRNRGFAEANNGLSLLSYAWKKWTQGEWACVIDPIIDPSSEEVKRCFQVGLLCVQDRPEDRPLMSSVVVMLVSKIDTIPQPHPPGYYVDGSAPSSSTTESVNHASFTIITLQEKRLSTAAKKRYLSQP